MSLHFSKCSKCVFSVRTRRRVWRRSARENYVQQEGHGTCAVRGRATGATRYSFAIEQSAHTQNILFISIKCSAVHSVPYCVRLVALLYLNGVKLWGRPLKVALSKHSLVQLPRETEQVQVQLSTSYFLLMLSDNLRRYSSSVQYTTRCAVAASSTTIMRMRCDAVRRSRASRRTTRTRRSIASRTRTRRTSSTSSRRPRCFTCRTSRALPAATLPFRTLGSILFYSPSFPIARLNL